MTNAVYAAVADLFMNYTVRFFQKNIVTLIQEETDVTMDVFNWTSELSDDIKGVLQFLYIPVAKLLHELDDKLADQTSTIFNELPDVINESFTDLNNFLQNVSDPLQSFLSDPFTFLSEGWNNVITNVTQAFIDVFDPVADVFKEGFDNFGNIFNNAFSFFSSAFTDFTSFFKTDFLSNITNAFDNFGNIFNSFKEIFGNFFDNTEGFFNNFENFFSIFTALTQLLRPGGFFNFFKNASEQLSQFANAEIFKPVKDMLDKVADSIVDLTRKIFDALNSKLKEVNDALKRCDIAPAIDTMLLYGAMGLGTATLISALGVNIVGSGFDVDTLGNYVNALFNPQLVSDVVIGVNLDIGIKEPMEQCYRAMYRTTIPDVRSLRTYYLRQYIDDTTVRTYMAKLGYEDEIIEAEIETWNVIPSISDLIDFVVKEVIPPDDFYSWAAKQGLNEYWAKNFWEAHWRMPSPEQLQEAFWRGIINEEEYKKYIVLWDYKPEARPGMSISDRDIMFNLSYKLPGRLDTRWMIRWGLITLDELKTLTKMEGYHPDWIEKIAQTELLNQMLDERTRVLSQLRSQYRDGYISRDEFIKKVQELRFTEQEIDLIIQAADYEYNYTRAKDNLDYYVTLLKRGTIAKSQFIDDLVSQGWEREKIETLADFITARRDNIDYPEQTKDERSSLRTTLVKMFKEGLIDVDRLKTELKTLQFSDAEIALTVQRAEYEYEYDRYFDALNALKEAYRKNLITDSEFIQALMNLGLAEDRANLIVARESWKKAPKAKVP